MRAAMAMRAVRTALVARPVLAAARPIACRYMSGFVIPAEDPGLSDPSFDAEGRPPEDDLAQSAGYHAMLVAVWKGENRVLWKRLQAIKDVRAVVVAASVFVRSQANCPRVLEYLQHRLLADGALSSLDGAYLGEAADALAVSRAGTPELWAAVAARAGALGPDGLRPFDAVRVLRGLSGSAALAPVEAMLRARATA